MSLHRTSLQPCRVPLMDEEMSKYDSNSIKTSFVSRHSPPRGPLPAFASPLTRPVERAFAACTGPAQKLHTHPRAISRIKASRYGVYPHHRVLGIRRNRVHPLGRSPILAFEGAECGDVHVHDLDGACLPRPIRGLYCMEREYHQLGTSVVRFLYAYTPLRLVHIFDQFIQLFASKSPLPSRGPPAFSASFATSTVSLSLPLREPLRVRCVVR
jgi:hypothetical protein